MSALASVSDLLLARSSLRAAQTHLQRARVAVPRELFVLVSERLEELHAAEHALTRAIYAARKVDSGVKPE